MPYGRRGRSRSRSRGRKSLYSTVVQTKANYIQNGRQAHHSRFGYEPPMGRLLVANGNRAKQVVKVNMLWRSLCQPNSFTGSASIYGQALQISDFFQVTSTAGAAPFIAGCPDIWRVLDGFRSFTITGMKMVGWVPVQCNSAPTGYQAAMGRAWSFGEVIPTNWAMIDTTGAYGGLPSVLPGYQGNATSYVYEEQATFDMSFKREKIPTQSFTTTKNDRQFFKRFMRVPALSSKREGVNTLPLPQYASTPANSAPPLLVAGANSAPNQSECFITYVADLSNLNSTSGTFSIPVMWKGTLYLTTYDRYDIPAAFIPIYMKPVVPPEPVL